MSEEIAIAKLDILIGFFNDFNNMLDDIERNIQND